MKRLYVIPFLSALLGGGIVVVVIAALGGLGSSQKTVTEIQTAAPVASAGTTSTATQSTGKSSGGLTAHEIYAHAAPSVAYVTSTIVRKSESPFGFGETSQQGIAAGSGFVINSNGTLLTNWHVVENAIKVTVSFEHGKTVNAQVIGKDPSQDLALLKISTEGLTLHPLKLGDSAAAQVGDPVLAIGNPFNQRDTLTTGIISALQRKIEAPNGFAIENVLQTDAPINPGNSGGPLLNAEGEVIGINSQIETGGGGSNGNVGIGFAVPINTAKQELPELEKGGTVSGAYLGVSTLTVDGSLSELNLPVKEGALVQTVEAGTPAAKAGIHAGNLEVQISGSKVVAGGDIIIGVNGKKIASSEALASAIESKKPDATVTIKLLRANGSGGYTEKTVTATLTKRPNSKPNPTGGEEGG
ncbi:MAG TPA: trypsin-like peptidase domain-containing protein [Solirubrobacteraceae bacterium]|jgi:S1-C subfamily serine protease|nr:trypsin-like peptidase domain-containing protein [Solirubrobacteraceae bacterium]